MKSIVEVEIGMRQEQGMLGSIYRLAPKISNVLQNIANMTLFVPTAA